MCKLSEKLGIKTWDIHKKKKSLFGDSKVMSCVVDLRYSLRLSCCSEAGAVVLQWCIKT